MIPLSLRVFILILTLSMLIPVGSALAWPTDTRMNLITTAFSLLPGDLQQILSPYREQILTAASRQSADVQSNTWNLHADEPGLGPARITELFSTLTTMVRLGVTDMESLAENLGELAGLLAELNYPLNTDDYARDEDLVRLAYNDDISQFLGITSGLGLSPRFWAVPLERAKSTAYRTNRFYHQVASAYNEGSGYDELVRITEFCAENAVQDIYAAWSTLWAQANATTRHILSVSVNRLSFSPGDILTVNLSAVAAKTGVSPYADLYLAFSSGSELTYITAQGGFSTEPTSFRQNWQVPEVGDETVLPLVVPGDVQEQTLDLYALLVELGGQPEDPLNWTSNLTAKQLHLDATVNLDLHQLSDEIYLFPARTVDGTTYALPLRRWDLIFTGDYQDNPTTPEDESWSNALIPGEFNHVIVYLGRDQSAEPWGMEMTTSTTLTSLGQGSDLRIIRLPEFEANLQDTEASGFAIGPKNLFVYQSRWAMRLNPESRASLQEHEDQLLLQMEEDWANGFPYQLEFDWSGTTTDTAIQLIDDGRANGASCTDYWLSLFEDYAGVCIEGARISAAELEDYFLFDPVGAQVTVPEIFNPFPFTLTIAQAMAFGFSPVDPPAHLFSCDGAMETGVPIPNRLRSSPLLEEISPALLPVDWPLLFPN